MRFYKEVWGIIWEFNNIGEYISFMLGRLVGIIIFVVCLYFLATCSSFSDNEKYQKEYDYTPIPAEFYEY